MRERSGHLERRGLEKEWRKSEVFLCRCKLTGKLACVANGVKSGQALVGTLSL